MEGRRCHLGGVSISEVTRSDCANKIPPASQEGTTEIDVHMATDPACSLHDWNFIVLISSPSSQFITFVNVPGSFLSSQSIKALPWPARKPMLRVCGSGLCHWRTGSLFCQPLHSGSFDKGLRGMTSYSSWINCSCTFPAFPLCYRRRPVTWGCNSDAGVTMTTDYLIRTWKTVRVQARSYGVRACAPGST